MLRATTITFVLFLASIPLAAQPIRAWVWNDNPSSSGIPNGSYQFNSTGAVNSVTYFPKGKYRVDLPGLGLSGGTVHVTAYGGNHHCKTAGWGPSGATMQVLVNCFSPSGEPTDGRFTMVFYKQSQPNPYTDDAYLWANSPSVSSYTPSSAYQ